MCFISVFEREFYVFPCGHAFHRDCVFDFLCSENYTPKDPKVRVMKDKARSKLNDINQTRAVGKEMRRTANETNNQRNDSEDKGLLSGIFNTLSFRAGSVASKDQLNSLNEQQKKFTLDEEKKIRQKLADIDAIFKSECIFCGIVLLDMIDNTITIEDDKESEFGAALQPKPKRGNEKQLSWDII